MGKKIYGVDLSENITPIMVRVAFLRCFFQAHKKILDDMREYGNFKSEQELQEMEKLDVKILIKKYFCEIGGSFDSPTKEELISVCNRLEGFASNFRKTGIIKKHYGEIMQLVEKLR